MKPDRHHVAQILFEKNASVYNPITNVMVYVNVNVLLLMGLVNYVYIGTKWCAIYNNKCAKSWQFPAGFWINEYLLTNCGLVIIYGDIDQLQHFPSW